MNTPTILRETWIPFLGFDTYASDPYGWTALDDNEEITAEMEDEAVTDCLELYSHLSCTIS